MPTQGPAKAIHAYRGHRGDSLYAARRSLQTVAGLLTDKLTNRLSAPFAVDEHVEDEATCGIDQQMIAAYRDEDRRGGRDQMVKLIESISHGAPAAPVEIITLGRMLKKRADDVGAYFDRPAPATGRHRPSTDDSTPSAAAHSAFDNFHQPNRQEPARDRSVQTETTP